MITFSSASVGAPRRPLAMAPSSPRFGAEPAAQPQSALSRYLLEEKPTSKTFQNLQLTDAGALEGITHFREILDRRDTAAFTATFQLDGELYIAVLRPVPYQADSREAPVFLQNLTVHPTEAGYPKLSITRTPTPENFVSFEVSRGQMVNENSNAGSFRDGLLTAVLQAYQAHPPASVSAPKSPGWKTRILRALGRQ